MPAATSPPANLPAVCTTVAPSINGEPYMYYASLPRRSSTNCQHLHHTSRTLPRNINQFVPRYSREQTYLMRPSPTIYRHDHAAISDRYVVPTFGMLGLGEVLQQYSSGVGREPGSNRILTSLATSYAITTSDSDEDLEWDILSIYLLAVYKHRICSHFLCMAFEVIIFFEYCTDIFCLTLLVQKNQLT